MPRRHNPHRPPPRPPTRSPRKVVQAAAKIRAGKRAGQTSAAAARWAWSLHPCLTLRELNRAAALAASREALPEVSAPFLDVAAEIRAGMRLGLSCDEATRWGWSMHPTLEHGQIAEARRVAMTRLDLRVIDAPVEAVAVQVLLALERGRSVDAAMNRAWDVYPAVEFGQLRQAAGLAVRMRRRALVYRLAWLAAWLSGRGDALVMPDAAMPPLCGPVAPPEVLGAARSILEPLRESRRDIFPELNGSFRKPSPHGHGRPRNKHSYRS